MKYELITVLKQDLGDAQVKDECAKIELLLKNSGAHNVAVNNMGKKELAYLVKKNRFGHYICFTFDSTVSNTNADVANALRISETVIKFQNHRIGDKPRKFKGNPKRKVIDQSDDFYDSSDDASYA